MKTLIILTIFIFTISTSKAQPNTFFGKITDSENQNIGFATVRLKSSTTDKQVFSNDSGEFNFSNIPPAIYKITIRYIGHHNVDTTIKIDNGDSIRLFFKMKQMPPIIDPAFIIVGMNADLAKTEIKNFKHAPINFQEFTLDSVTNFSLKELFML